MRSSLTSRGLWIFVVILIVDKVWYNVRFTNVYKEWISDDNRSLQLGKSSVPFSKIFDFILSVKWVTLNVKLTTLVIIASAHHGVHCWHVFAGIWIVWVVHWNYEVILLFSQNLFASGVFDIPSSSPGSIVWAFLVIITFGSVLYTEVSESIEFLSSWTILIPYEWLPLKIVVLLVW